MKKKVTAARALHVSHMEVVQNVVRLHTASSNAALDEISTLASSNAHSIKEVGADTLSLVAFYLIYLSFAHFNCLPFVYELWISSFRLMPAKQLQCLMIFRVLLQLTREK